MFPLVLGTAVSTSRHAEVLIGPRCGRCVALASVRWPCVSKSRLTKWQGHRDSNPRPADLESAALPTELYPCGPSPLTTASAGGQRTRRPRLPSDFARRGALRGAPARAVGRPA